jgi:hypothetical protein
MLDADNVLIRKEDPQGEAKPVTIYDAEARNRFEFTITGDDGLKYDTAHIYGPESDDRYMQWVREFNIKGNEDDIAEESREATVRLWDDLVVEVENIEYDPQSDWKSLIDHQEKIESLNSFHAVAIVEPEEIAQGKRVLGGNVETQVVFTECWFNGEAVQQKHVIKKKSFELEKKYSRIQAKRFKQQKIGGSLKRKTKIQYVPQDAAIGELYDEMFVSQEGFANGVIPLRFKTQVTHSIFASKLDPKKSER